MRVIHKFPVTVGSTAQIMVTQAARIRHFAEQNGELYIWVELDPGRPDEYLNYRVFGTGEPISPPVDLAVNHRFSCLAQGGAYVWHLFEVTDGR